MTLCVSGDETLASGAAEITRIFAGICLSVYLSVFLSACLTQLVYVFRVTPVIVIWHRQHKNLYHKVANRGTSRLVATQRIYWLLMKGKFNAYLLWTFGEKLIFWNSSPVYCLQLYSIYFLATWTRCLKLQNFVDNKDVPTKQKFSHEMKKTSS